MQRLPNLRPTLGVLGALRGRQFRPAQVLVDLQLGAPASRATGLTGIWSQPVSHESVKGTVAAILKRIQNAPHVEVYRTPAEAGISIHDPMPKGGTLPDRRIVIFSDANTGTMDVMRTVFHAMFQTDRYSHGELAHVVEDFLSQFARPTPVRILDSAVGVLPGASNGDGISGAVHRGRIHLFLEHIPGPIDAVKTLSLEMLQCGDS